MKVHEHEEPKPDDTEPTKKVEPTKAPASKSVTCPKCVTKFDGSTGDIEQEAPEAPPEVPPENPPDDLDIDTDYDENLIGPPLMNRGKK